jgi:hypothetical protein
MLCVRSLSAATSQAQRYAIVGLGICKVNTLEVATDAKSSETEAIGKDYDTRGPAIVRKYWTGLPTGPRV